MEGDNNPGSSAPDVQDDPPEKTRKQKRRYVVSIHAPASRIFFM